MTKIYRQLLPGLAIFLVAVFMYQLRVHHVGLTPMLSLMLLYMIGMLVGGFFNIISEERLSSE